MGSLIGIRRRIKSTKSIAQMTKAMQMVSASKMRRAQDAALATRPFTLKLHEILARVASAKSEAEMHALTTTRPEKKVLVILVSTTKGLCGGLNVNLHRTYAAFAASIPSAEISVVTVGRKARWVLGKRDVNLAARFDNIGETPTFEETRTIARYAMDSFLDASYDAIYLAYPRFVSTLTSEMEVTKLLPVSPVVASTATAPSNYTIEPSPQSLIDKLLPYQVEMTTHQALLEARATEHSARMVAMKNASDNARDLIGSLTLDYNSARQSQVTSELLDVTTARMALNE
jgi:F-type H+-transporting ATPase subunit gamma